MNVQGRQADSGGATVATASAPDCWACRHFAVSWQPAMPYLCRLMGFRSRSWPALEVLRADGRPCQGFAPKTVGAAERRQARGDMR